jgi:Flp pilus assembly protein TadG
MTRLLQNESGQALIEFAMFISVFVLILAGVVDYGIYIRTEMMLTEAAAAGAQFGIIPGNQKNYGGMQFAAQQAGTGINGLVVPTPVNIYTCTPGGTAVSNLTTCIGYGTPIMYVQVTANANVPAVLKWSGISSSLQLSATATYRVPWTK